MYLLVSYKSIVFKEKKAKGSFIPFVLVSYSFSFIGCSISYVIGIPISAAI